MSFFREASFEVGGETYTFIPSMRLLDRIEGQGLSSERISYEAMNGNIMKGAMARFMGIVLRDAGMDITDERLLQEVEHNPKQALALFMDIRNALYTEPPEEMLRAPDGKDEAGKKKTKSRKASG